MKFTVKRSKWARGNPTNHLLNKDGTRCCLGFLAQACNIPDECIQDVCYPGEDMDLPGDDTDYNALWPKDLLTADVVSDIIGKDMPDERFARPQHNAHAIGNTNDHPLLNHSQREAALIKQFAAIGIEVTFED